MLLSCEAIAMLSFCNGWLYTCVFYIVKLDEVAIYFLQAIATLSLYGSYIIMRLYVHVFMGVAILYSHIVTRKENRWLSLLQ